MEFCIDLLFLSSARFIPVVASNCLAIHVEGDVSLEISMIEQKTIHEIAHVADSGNEGARPGRASALRDRDCDRRPDPASAGRFAGNFLTSYTKIAF